MSNFITRWGMAKCDSRVDCSVCVNRRCYPRKELSEATGCSEQLVELLQSAHGAVTHPNIADRIADYIGVSPEERDEIVADKHNGTYIPGTSTPPPFIEPYLSWNARYIVVLNRYGTELCRYGSADKVSYHTGASSGCILTRCKRELTVVDEFDAHGITFRFADEWDAMTEEERIADLNGHIKNEEGDKNVQDG